MRCWGHDKSVDAARQGIGAGGEPPNVLVTTGSFTRGLDFGSSRVGLDRELNRQRLSNVYSVRARSRCPEMS